MTADLKPYPSMKDSGVEWLGQVPEHWEVRRLRTILELRVSNVDKHAKEEETPVRLCNYVDVYKNDRISEQMAFMRATATPEEQAAAVTNTRGMKATIMAWTSILNSLPSQSWNTAGPHSRIRLKTVSAGHSKGPGMVEAQ